MNDIIMICDTCLKPYRTPEDTNQHLCPNCGSKKITNVTKHVIEDWDLRLYKLKRRTVC